jgi:hypothetical protein
MFGEHEGEGTRPKLLGEKFREGGPGGDYLLLLLQLGDVHDQGVEKRAFLDRENTADPGVGVNRGREPVYGLRRKRYDAARLEHLFCPF